MAEAGEHDPGRLKVAYACDAMRLKLEGWGQAVDHDRVALDRHPDDAALHHEFGWALLKPGHVRAATPAYRRANARGPAPTVYRTNPHLALAGLGHYTEDGQQLRAAAEQDKGSPVMEVNLVITVDTMLTHLPGAVGRPVWSLLAYVPDWRWILGRDNTPWYPTMRLLRQPALNDWAGVFRAVRRELAARLSQRRGARQRA